MVDSRTVTSTIEPKNHFISPDKSVSGLGQALHLQPNGSDIYPTKWHGKVSCEDSLWPVITRGGHQLLQADNCQMWQLHGVKVSESGLFGKTQKKDERQINSFEIHQDWVDIVILLKEKRAAAASLIQSWYRKAIQARQIKFLAVVQNLTEIRNDAATQVQRVYKGWIVRRDTWFIRTHAIVFRLDVSNATFVSSCTLPPWSLQSPLKYSRLTGLHYLQIDKIAVKPGMHKYRVFSNGKLVTEGYLRVMENLKVEVVHLGLSGNSVVQNLDNIDIGLTGRIQYGRQHSPNSQPRNLQHAPLDLPICDSKNINLAMTMRSCKAARPRHFGQELSPENSSDAVFIDELTQSFGIADGVGSWKTLGLDPGFFAEEMMKLSEKMLLKHYVELKDQKTKDLGEYLREVMSMAYKQVSSFGSSTALLGLCFRSRLVVANLGDSTVMVLRQTEFGKLREVFRSKEMQHSFNCPFQLSRLPTPKQYRELIRKGYGMLVKYLQEVKNQVQDSPEAARLYSIPLKPNDIIIAGSDGLFDNIFDSVIIQLAEKAIKTHSNPADLCSYLAETLTVAAVSQSFQKDYMSPFAKAAKKMRKCYVGGKPDDVSVCVGVLN